MTVILIIEDEEALREALIDLLHFEGYQAVGAADGLAGLQAARERHPDLIICDIRMPLLDGYGVLLELSRSPETSSIPFIFLTAHASREYLRRGMTLGADDYVTKPFAHEELLAAIRTRLQKQTRVRAAYEQRIEHFREQLMHTLPHEFRTPLTAVLGYAEVLAADAAANTLDPGRTLEMAQAIVQAGNRLHRLVENYLLYAQVEILKLDEARLAVLRTQVTPHPDFEIDSVCRREASLVEREKDLVVGGEPHAVATGEDTLRKIAQEVVSNAFKFSAPGQPVEVHYAPDRAHFAIQVRDHGRGMTREQIQQVGAYMQFNRKLYEQQGSGMGLIVARRLAELHQGWLHMDTPADGGLQVTIRLPLAQNGLH